MSEMRDDLGPEAFCEWEEMQNDTPKRQEKELSKRQFKRARNKLLFHSKLR